MASSDIALLIKDLSEKQGKARKLSYDRLIALISTDLRTGALQHARGEREFQQLQPSTLVHEAYERMLGQNIPFADRTHFLNVAAAAMRRILIERARSVEAAKRGSIQPQSPPIEDVVQVVAEQPNFLIDLDSALNDLRPDQIQLVELRYFAGFTIEETAAIMRISPETVKKRWSVVKSLLFDKIHRRSDTGLMSIQTDFDIQFDPAFDAAEVKELLSALADYYRGCGGAGFELDLEPQECTAREPVHA